MKADAAPPADAAPSQAIRVLASTTLAQALATMAWAVLPAIAPRVAQALGVPSAWVGYQVSLVYAAAMLSSVWGGPVARRLGAARTTQLALALCASGSALAAAGSVLALLPASVLMGLGYGLANPAAAHLLARYTEPRRRNLIFSIKQTGVPLGGIAAALTAPGIAVALGWQWALGLVPVAALALALFIQPRRAAWDDDRDRQVRMAGQGFGGVPAVWRSPVLRWLSLSAFCFAGVQLSVTTFTVNLLTSEVGFGLVAAGLVLSVVQAGGVAGRIFWGLVADRVGSSALVLLAIGSLMTLAGLAAAGLSPAWPGAAVYALFFAFGVTTVAWNGVFLAEVARLAPRESVSVITGGALFFTFGGVLTWPSVFAFAYRLLGSYTTIFAFSALVALAGVGCVAAARRELALS